MCVQVKPGSEASRLGLKEADQVETCLPSYSNFINIALLLYNCVWPFNLYQSIRYDTIR